MGNQPALQKAQYHAWFHHHDADGFITVAQRVKGAGFRQYHYRPEDLAVKLGEWTGEDVYFSQNTFYRPQRSIENIRQLRSLYVDLDFYLFNYDLSWVMGKLQHEYFGEVVPDPNIIIFSGQGLVLIWLIEPVPYKALPLWQAIQNHFLAKLSDLGGDPKAVDAARIFRIAGSVNSKNGAEVKAEYRHDYKYELRQLQADYLPELITSGKPKKGRKKRVQQLFNTYRLHYARLLDLIKLVELRDYDVYGHRELICFLYRYWLCCYTNDPDEALKQTHTFNLQFRNPLSMNEVEKATRSAEKAWEARSNDEANRRAQELGYPGAGYNLKNSKIIDWLGITPEEMKNLQTIIDGNEKRRRKRERDREAKRQERRSQGVVPRSEYEAARKADKQHAIDMLKRLMKKHPKAKKKDLAAMLGVSERHLRRLKQQL